MVQALNLIQSQTLSTSALSVSFTAISGGYRDLRFVIKAANTTSATATDAYFRINNDSGSNYSRVSMTGNGSAASSASASGTELYLDNWTVTTGESALYILDFLDYSQTDKHKTILFKSGVAGGVAMIAAARWASTTAITQIDIYCTDQKGSGTPDSWAAGSTFYLYGVLA